MRRLGLYARFSSDRQHERSVDDQLAACRRRAAELGDVIVHEAADQALTGAHLLSRPGILALLAAAEAGAIDVVLAEALDRLSRDQADTATLYKRLAFHGVAIETLSEGAVNELHVGLRGTMNALFLKDLAHKIRRGQRGQVERGFAAGGRTYGYRVRRETGTDGEPVRGLREIDPDEAAIVRRIFDDYLAGRSPRAIAAALNAEGVPGPTGGRWNASTINGARGRANGILQNPVYDGRPTWNRVRMVRDPLTGRRVSRVNPAAEWVTRADEALRIVAAETFAAARRLKARAAAFPPHVQRRPRHLLSGLMACGSCGGPYVSVGRGRVGCARHKETGTCNNGRTLTLAEVERRALAGLKERLVAPDLLAEAFAVYRTERAAARRAAEANAVRARRRAAELDQAIERLVDAIAAGTDTPATRARLKTLEAERAALAGDDAGAVAPLDRGAEVIELHPAFPEIYRRKVEALEEVLAGDARLRGEAAQILRSVIDRLVIHPAGPKRPVAIELHGSLAGVLALVQGRRAGEACRVTVVAEERVGQYPTCRPTLTVWV